MLLYGRHAQYVSKKNLVSNCQDHNVLGEILWKSSDSCHNVVSKIKNYQLRYALAIVTSVEGAASYG